MSLDAETPSRVRTLGLFLVLAGVAGIATGFGLGLLPPLVGIAGHGAALLPPRIIPDWQVLPYFALLRSVPEKLYGVATVFAALLAPMAWPWMRADRFRRGRLRLLWGVLCLALAVDWIGLGLLGSRPLDEASRHWVWALAGYYFAFFLVVPVVLGWFAGRRLGRGRSGGAFGI